MVDGAACPRRRRSRRARYGSELAVSAKPVYDLAPEDGLAYAQTLLDLIKAFEKLPHDLIAKAAKKLGYCLYTLRLSLAAYRLPRAIGIDGMYSESLSADHKKANAYCQTFEDNCSEH